MLSKWKPSERTTLTEETERSSKEGNELNEKEQGEHLLAPFYILMTEKSLKLTARHVTKKENHSDIYIYRNNIYLEDAALNLFTITLDIPSKKGESPFDCLESMKSLHKKNILRFLPLRFKYRMIPEDCWRLGMSDYEVVEAWKGSEYVPQCTFTSIKTKDAVHYCGHISAEQKRDLENRIADVLDISPESVYAPGYVFDLDYVIDNVQLARDICDLALIKFETGTYTRLGKYDDYELKDHGNVVIPYVVKCRFIPIMFSDAMDKWFSEVCPLPAEKDGQEIFRKIGLLFKAVLATRQFSQEEQYAVPAVPR